MSAIRPVHYDTGDEAYQQAIQNLIAQMPHLQNLSHIVAERMERELLRQEHEFETRGIEDEAKKCPVNLLRDLERFTGTGHYYKVGLPPIKITDGVYHLAENANCYWLVNMIASCQLFRKVMKERFQCWRLKKNAEGKGCVVDAWTDTPDKSTCICRQDVEYTDFPFDEFQMYFVNGILLLKNEY